MTIGARRIIGTCDQCGGPVEGPSTPNPPWTSGEAHCTDCLAVPMHRYGPVIEMEGGSPVLADAARKRRELPRS